LKKPLPNFWFFSQSPDPNRQVFFLKKKILFVVLNTNTYLTKKIEKAIHNIFNLRKRRKNMMISPCSSIIIIIIIPTPLP